jgi:hypothetical protein
MTPKDIQKLELIANSAEEWLAAVSEELIAEAIKDGHCISNFTLIEESSNINDNTKVVRAFCVLCPFEIDVEYTKDNGEDFIRVRSAPEVCSLR